jgi:hypothetical protein
MRRQDSSAMRPASPSSAFLALRKNLSREQGVLPLVACMVSQGVLSSGTSDRFGRVPMNNPG